MPTLPENWILNKKNKRPTLSFPSKLVPFDILDGYLQWDSDIVMIRRKGNGFFATKKLAQDKPNPRLLCSKRQASNFLNFSSYDTIPFFSSFPFLSFTSFPQQGKQQQTITYTLCHA